MSVTFPFQKVPQFFFPLTSVFLSAHLRRKFIWWRVLNLPVPVSLKNGVKKGNDYEKCPPEYLRGIFSGDGRTRTAVQTPHQAAFYTLSHPLVVGRRLPGDRPLAAYPLNLGGA